MVQTTLGSVALKDNTAISICKKSFLSGSDAWSAVRRVHKSHGMLLSVSLLVVCAVVFGVLYLDSPARAQEYDSRGSVQPLAAAPVRIEESTYISVIPFETITYSDPDLYAGETSVITEGRDGVRRVTEILEYSGDELSAVTAVSSTIIAKPVAETVAVGTLERPKTASCGTYIWPAEGVLSSHFGRRKTDVGSSNHQGIDIAGDKGDSIYAADGGEVILADRSVSGYGLLVQILHDNGDVTYYAHNSEVLVAVGERVCQGQEIAKMGSTGVSSGVHCHFEIRIDGVPVNPTKHLP